MLHACNRSPATVVAHACSRGSSRRRSACCRAAIIAVLAYSHLALTVSLTLPHQKLEAVHCVLQACNRSGARLQPRELEAPLPAAGLQP
eukprot:scaffold24926_cov67-Phaeocystis_antarctica.AAC.4